MKFSYLIFIASLLLTFSSSAFGLKEYEVRSAELQWAICEPSPVDLVKKLGINVKALKTQQFSLFDTKDLNLHKNGVLIKLRGADEVFKSTVKVRIGHIHQMPQGYKNKDIRCEVDYYRDETKTACALDYEAASYAEIISSDQLEFIKAVAPPSTSLVGIKEFGPYMNTIFKVMQNYDGYEVKIDYLKTAQNKSFTEISFRVPLEKANFMFAKFSTELLAKKISLCEEQVGRASKILKN